MHEEFAYDKALRLISQDHLTFTYTPEGNLLSMCEAGKRTTYWSYTPGGKVHSKTKPDGSIIFYEYNSQGELVQVGSRAFAYDGKGRLIEGTGFTRELDPFGNILKETWANGLVIESSYDDWHRPTQRTLPDGSYIRYQYEGPFLRKVLRKAIYHGYFSSSEYEYTHSYNEYNRQGLVLEETGAFTSQYSYDKTGRRIYHISPYFEQELVYDPTGNLIQKGDTSYSYDDANQLISEEGKVHLAYDQHYNCIQKDENELLVDELNQREDLAYDLNGNLIRDGFVYDEFDQLVQTDTDQFTYDALGRRISSGDTCYFYIEDEEIGSFEDGQIKELKVLGTTTPVAIEIAGKPFAPVVDVQNTIRQLIDWESKKVAFENTSDAFGQNTSEKIPYAYVGKRLDPSTELIYFGKRFYDPSLARWLTPDPLGAVDHSNLYQYLFNNPYTYRDLHGEFAFAIPLLFLGAEIALPAISACVTAITYTAAAGTVAYGGYKLVETINEHDYFSNDHYSRYNFDALYKSGSVDPSLPEDPDDLLKRPGWKETTHPDAKEKGHRTFENEKTGEIIRHDRGNPEKKGHRSRDHYHHQVPNGKGGYNYVDGKGNTVPSGSNQSHLYPNNTK